ncbi:hypothetical protein AKJ16_DCAP00549 [Drosera capensis]
MKLGFPFPQITSSSTTTAAPQNPRFPHQPQNPLKFRPQIPPQLPHHRRHQVSKPVREFPRFDYESDYFVCEMWITQFMRCGMVREAVQAFDGMKGKGIEPGNRGNYVILANMYSRRGKLKEGDEIRRFMGTKGKYSTEKLSGILTGSTISPMVLVPAATTGEDSRIFSSEKSARETSLSCTTSSSPFTAMASDISSIDGSIPSAISLVSSSAPISSSAGARTSSFPFWVASATKVSFSSLAPPSSTVGFVSKWSSCSTAASLDDSAMATVSFTSGSSSTSSVLDPATFSSNPLSSCSTAASLDNSAMAVASLASASSSAFSVPDSVGFPSIALSESVTSSAVDLAAYASSFASGSSTGFFSSTAASPEDISVSFDTASSGCSTALASAVSWPMSIASNVSAAFSVGSGEDSATAIASVQYSAGGASRLIVSSVASIEASTSMGFSTNPMYDGAST